MEKSKYIFVKKVKIEDVVRDQKGVPILDVGQLVVNDLYIRSKIDSGILEEIDVNKTGNVAVDEVVEEEISHTSRKKK